MKTQWDPKAKAALRQVARYINMRFGRKARQDFMQKVKDKETQLKRSPGIGLIDPLFEDRPQAYRSVIINGLNKLVYRVEGDTIHIVGFWDTRMDDEDQASQVK
jgi:plasmid stabilization system protein ParE